MEAPKLAETWASAAVIVGFQLVSFSWRLSREVELMKRHPDVKNWFPLADYLNLLSMLCLVFTVFVFPEPKENAELGLKVSLILFAGYPLATLGHYRLFRPAVHRPRPYCTPEEASFAVVTILVATWFMISHNFGDYLRMNWWIPGVLICLVILAAYLSWREERKQ